MAENEMMRHVQRLEKQNRAMKVLVGAVGVVAVACLLLQTVQPVQMRAAEVETPKSLDAEQFVVRDSMGNGRVFIGVTAAGPLLEFRDARGKTRMSMAMEKDDLMMTVYDGTALHSDPHGRMLARMTMNKDGTSMAILETGVVRGSLATKASKAAPTLLLLDAAGKAVWTAPAPATPAK